MKICVVGSGGDWGEGNNAASIHSREIAEGLLKHCHDVMLVGASTQKILISNKELDITTLTLSKNKFFKFLFQYIFSYFQFRALLKRYKPDTVYARFGSFSLASALAAKKWNIPYIVELNGIKKDEIASEKKGKVLIFFLIQLARVYERFVFHFCSGFVAVTEGIKKYLEEYHQIFQQNIEVVPNGVNANLFKPRKISKTILGLNESATVLGFVGNLTRWQGVDFLIRAFSEIHMAFPETFLVIVGEGREKLRLQNLTETLRLASKVIFLKQEPYTNIPNIINAIDICIAPWVSGRNTKSGLSPLKLFEYLACGKPVVASRIPGVTEIIESSQAGVLVEPENVGSLRDTLSSMLARKAEWQHLGVLGREFVIMKYTWQHSADSVFSFCKRVAQL